MKHLKSLNAICWLTFIALLNVMTFSQTVSHRSYIPKETDLPVAGALTICDQVAENIGILKVNPNRCSLSSEFSLIHGEKRTLWRVQYGSGIQFKIDVITRRVVSLHDFKREESQFKGRQPKRDPSIRTKEQARQRLLRIARSFGIPSNCPPDSFDFNLRPDEPRFSAGRAGMTFKSPDGERIAGISIDLLDGGVNGAWFASWKVKAGVPLKK